MSVLKLKNRNVVNSKGNLIDSNDSLTAKLNKVSNRNLRVNVDYRTCRESLDDGICVYVSDVGAVSASSALTDTECSGIAFKPALSGEKVCYITSGKVQNSKFNFTAPFGRPVWVSISGVPSDVAPTSGYLQNIGISLSPDSFLLRIQPKIITSTSQFKDKRYMPVTHQMYQKQGPLYKLSTVDDPQPEELPISDGAIFLSDRNITAIDDAIAIRIHQQPQASASWVINVGNNVDVANIEIITQQGSTYVKVSPVSIQLTEGVLTILLSRPYSGMVTYCVLN